MPLRFDEVKTLPYAILEVKTQSDAPAWVEELKNSGYLIPAPNFSKFLYGTCKLWPDNIDFTPAWWDMLTELETSIFLPL
jgi:SPX domain protein involved in polyphosphate accumulation